MIWIICSGALITPGNATIDMEMAIGSNEPDNAHDYQPNPTTMAQFPCSEATDSGPNVRSTGAVTQAVGDNAVPLTVPIPKQSAVINNGDRLVEQNAL